MSCTTMPSGMHHVALAEVRVANEHKADKRELSITVIQIQCVRRVTELIMLTLDWSILLDSVICLLTGWYTRIHR